MALGTAGSPWVGGTGGPQQLLRAQLCPAVGQSQNQPKAGGQGTAKVWSQESSSPAPDPFLSHPEAAQQCWPFLPVHCRAQGSISSTPGSGGPGKGWWHRQHRGGGELRQQNTSRDKSTGKRCCQGPGVSPADLSLQHRWEFMNPKTSRGSEMSDLYCTDKWVTSAHPLLRGANGLPRLQVATCPKVTWWLWKEGDEAFPTEGWTWSGFPSLVPPGSVGEEPSTHRAHTRNQGM